MTFMIFVLSVPLVAMA